MIKIKFLNEKNFRDVTFIKNNNHLVTLDGINDINKSGFLAYNYSGKILLGDYSKYNFIYNITDNSIQLSDIETEIQNPIIEDMDNSKVSLLASNWKDEIEARLFYVELMTDSFIVNDEEEENVSDTAES